MYIVFEAPPPPLPLHLWNPSHETIVNLPGPDIFVILYEHRTKKNIVPVSELILKTFMSQRCADDLKMHFIEEVLDHLPRCDTAIYKPEFYAWLETRSTLPEILQHLYGRPDAFHY